MRYVPTGVPVADLHIVWDKVWPILAKAVARYPHVTSPYTEGMVLQKLFHREQQLWLCWDIDENQPMGACLTEIVTDDRFPDWTFLNYPLIAGRDWNKWGDELWMLTKAWGIENGCTHARGSGRRGWSRWYGFVECGTAEDTKLPIYVRSLKR